MSESALPLPLSELQRRVLGVLVEKAKTTPDSYPLSVSALVTGCNQKSNRDPVMDVEDYEVQIVLDELREMGAVEPVFGSRVERWRQLLKTAWVITGTEMAVLAELFLRGPQTVGELRGRASRMDAIPTLEVLHEKLESLLERELVVRLTPEGKRGTIVTHGFYPPEELAELKEQYATGAPVATRPAGKAGPDAVAELREELDALRAEVAELREELARLAGRD